MFIPSAITTLADMLGFLEPCVSDGLFDAVAYDDQSSPTKIVCTQDDNIILDVVYAAGGKWGFIPYLSTGVAASQNMHYVPEGRTWTTACRCKGGLYFTDGEIGWAIAKTSNGQTGCISQPITSTTTVYKATRFGDNPNLLLYQNGWTDAWDATTIYDRTHLTQIPVAGTWGSTDYFTTVFNRKLVQFAETGVQKIGGKQYGCIGSLAFLDEGEEETA